MLRRCGWIEVEMSAFHLHSKDKNPREAICGGFLLEMNTLYVVNLPNRTKLRL